MSNQYVSEDKIKANINYFGLIRKILPYFARHKGASILAVLVVLSSVAINRIDTFIVGHIIDHGIKAHNIEVVIRYLTIFLCLSALNLVLSYFQTYLIQRVGNRVLYYVREDLILHLEQLPMQYFNKNPTGRIITRATNDMATLGDLFSIGVLDIFIQSMNVLSIVGAMCLISVPLTLGIIILTPLFVWAAVKVSNLIRLSLRDSKSKLSAMNSYVAENLHGIKVVQLYNRARKNQEKYRELSNSYRDSMMEWVKNFSLIQPVMNSYNGGTLIIAILLGGWATHNNTLTIGAFVILFLNAQDLIHPFRQILDTYQQFQNSLTSAERVFQLFDEKVETRSTPDYQPLEAQSKIIGNIEIRNLNFQYEDHLPLVLKNFSLGVKNGESLALIGRTGSGKSTVVSLLQGFYTAPENTIFIDEKPIEQYAKQELRRGLGVIQQDPFVFRGTIAENVSLGDASISIERVRDALNKVGFLKLLEQTGRSLTSLVEEKGANLSLGERQLIAFARILAFDPPVLVLDEATANIDSQSEDLIQKATLEITQNRTSLIIAHRLSTIQHCDQIILLDKGEIIEQGSHDELSQRGGYYSQLLSAGLKSTEIEASV